MTVLVEQKLIDNLVRQRTEFIETNLQAVMLHKKALELASSIDSGIPTQNQGYIDCFDSVFHSISACLGENTRGRVRPKESFINHKSESELRSLITKAVDGQLWGMLFNRLGFFKHMSKKQQGIFNRACKDNPQPFAMDSIQSTLSGMYENRDSDLLDSLYDTFNDLSAAYVSNDKRKFHKKVVIEDAFLEYGSTFKLRSHEPLETLLTVIWRWVLVNKWGFDESGVKPNDIWSELSSILEHSEQDYDEIRSIKTHGIEFKFFRKKTVHVLFPESMIALLNDQLAKSNALPPC
ncbi:DUF4942 domain-containing protein (plasmid) [Vibrio campbellii]|uniref:DUF4942 domain-containing protein n=1 Tax=Vibrio campbellii TaxID=680 RepID=A0ABY5IKX8_9VIBR|nr:DUF4942 domain-containing protein [Vibrio campbellii]UTZ34953.1 DUF4942 domain-containing protein [Vibrio campbellii]